MRVLPPTFFQRNTLEVAHDLIGTQLVRRFDTETKRYTITEVEAYDGPDDLASHAAKGRTLRTEPMFWSGGYWYVYFIYGKYWMLNIVTGPADYPAAVLIRGVQAISGPGRLTRELAITQQFNQQLAEPNTGLWFEEPANNTKLRIVRTPRIGVQYAGPIWAQKPYRFIAQ